MQYKPFRKADFLTIPDAPNYEINGYFQVRNKKTGKKLKARTPKNKRLPTVTLCHNKKQIRRAAESFYRQAVMAVLEPNSWYPVKSVNNLYEIDDFGKVRNAATKKILKPIVTPGGCAYYNLSINDKSLQKSRRELMNEVFNSNIRKQWRPISIILSKEWRKYYFKSMRKAASFLASKVFYSATTLRNCMVRREKEICGYSVTYL